MKKLNIQGFTHTIALAVVVVLTGVAGTYYLVASNADSCSANPVSGVTSGPVSGQKCDSAVSGAVSSPTKPSPPPKTPIAPTPSKAVTSASCTINDLPASGKFNQVISPAVTIKNTDNQVLTTNYTSSVWPQNKAANKIDSKISIKNSTVQNLKPGQSVRHGLQNYTTQESGNKIARIYYNVVSTNPAFSCHSTSMKLP